MAGVEFKKAPTWIDRTLPIVSLTVWLSTRRSQAPVAGRRSVSVLLHRSLCRRSAEHQVEHRQPIYSGKCRGDSNRRKPAAPSRRESCAIRLRIPEHSIRFHDIVHGDVGLSNEVVSDPIICAGHGNSYNYVVVIDDALMKITHVIRGNNHLSNTPKQVALYEALGPAGVCPPSTILGSETGKPRTTAATSDRQFPRNGHRCRGAGELFGPARVGAAGGGRGFGRFSLARSW